MRRESGQMSVELAVLIPTLMIVGAIALNALGYLGECARFDRVAAEAVRVCATSPEYGQYSASARESEVLSYIEDAFEDSSRVEFSVDSVEIGMATGHEYGDSSGLVFSLVPTNTKYECSMRFSPVFFSGGIFGEDFGTVTHSCEFVVSPYEPQGWL